MQALLRQIEERRKTDPLVGAKIAGREITQRGLEALKGPRGVHVESLLVALGALAGYSCQAAARAFGTQRGRPDSVTFSIVETTSGERYFFGPVANQLLVENPTAVWKLLSETARQLGATSLPDIAEIARHSAQSVGTPAYGVPRVPPDHIAADSPRAYLKALWPALLPLLQALCPNPVEWPFAFAFSLQEVMTLAKGTIDARLALLIAMESAVPMSHIDFAAIA
jgi:hypothetical protein